MTAYAGLLEEMENAAAFELPVTAAFDPTKHPHRPAGSREGGQWAPKDAVAEGTVPAYDDTKLREAIRAEVEALAEWQAGKGEPYAPEEIQAQIDWMTENVNAGMQGPAFQKLRERLIGFKDVRIEPQVPTSEGLWASEPSHGAWTVKVGEDKYAPDFTVWETEAGDLEVPEALDITDTDFFAPGDARVGVYADALDSVRGVQRTGQVRLFRGMAAAERQAWAGGETIPVGKFFTTDETAALAKDVQGEFPELHDFEVDRDVAIETDPGVFQIVKPAVLRDGRIQAVTAGAETNDLNDRVAAGWARALPLEERLAAKYEQAGRGLARRARRRYERAQPITAAFDESKLALTAAVRPPNWLPQPDELVTPEDATAAAARTQAQRRAIVQAMVGSILGVEASRDAVFRALIEAQAGRQAERLVEGSRDAVARVILDAQVEGWGVPETAEAIQAELEAVSRWQSTMLARTDLISLSNASSVASASLLGADAPPYKVWLATSDEKTRPAHGDEGADGQTVPTDQSFTVGGESLAYPGDPSGSDGNVINCRCTVRYAWQPNPGFAPNAISASFSPSQPRYQTGVREGGRWRPESGEGTLDDLAARHPDAEIWASDHGDGITLHMIRTKPGARGTGAASRALRDLTAMADRRGVAMWLTPEAVGDDAPMSTDQLARWYRRHGWQEANGNGLMRRDPTRSLVAAYVEQQHPRDPGGEGGGRWIPKGTTAQDEKRLADNPKEVGLYGPGQHVWVNGVEHVITDLRFTDEGVPRVVLTNLETNEERLLAPDFPVQDEAPIAAPVVTKLELLEVTGRRLKDGDTFFTEKYDALGGEVTREEYRVVDASGRSYLRVVRVSDNKPGLLRKSARLLVSSEQFPDVARAQAKAAEIHVQGELGKVFKTSPGPNTKITKAANQASAELGRIVALPEDLPKIPLKETRSMTMGGAFKSLRNRRTGEVTPAEIVLRTAEDPLEIVNNTHHEVGHYLDLAGLGENGRYASAVRHPEVAGPLMDAIDASPPAQRIKAMRFSDADFRVVTNPGDDIFTERRFSPDREQIRYVDEPQEKFARAYEQYVATKTGGLGRTARYVEGASLPLDDLTLDPGESTNGFYGWYWSQQDFEPIAAEFDQMFRRVGWSKN